jgi:hypothetical protein
MMFPEPRGETRTLNRTPAARRRFSDRVKNRPPPKNYAPQARNVCLQLNTVTTQTSHLCPPNETTPHPLRPPRASGHLFQKRSFPRTGVHQNMRIHLLFN